LIFDRRGAGKRPAVFFLEITRQRRVKIKKEKVGAGFRPVLQLAQTFMGRVLSHRVSSETTFSRVGAPPLQWRPAPIFNLAVSPVAGATPFPPKNIPPNPFSASSRAFSVLENGFSTPSPLPTAPSSHPTAPSRHPTALSDEPTALSRHPTALSGLPTAPSRHPTALPDEPTALSGHTTASSNLPTALSGHAMASSNRPTASSCRRMVPFYQFGELNLDLVMPASLSL